MSPDINPHEVKKRSEKIILESGGEILDNLPTIDIQEPKTVEIIIDRALTINAMIQIYFGAPKNFIFEWIMEHVGDHALTPYEKEILFSENSLTEEEASYLYWSIESLWAIVWATNLINDLPFDQGAGDELASLSPNLQINEDRSKYETHMSLRPYDELYFMLDLYYRLHWWLRHSYLNNIDVPNVLLPIIIQRRAALEWVLDNDTLWDEVNLST